MSAHTPGPWYVDAENAGDGAGVCIDHGGRSIAIARTAAIRSRFFLNGREPIESAEAKANAQLIAAAPDMLEALKITAGNIRSLGPAGALGPVWESYAPWLRVVENAIARTETA